MSDLVKELYKIKAQLNKNPLFVDKKLAMTILDSYIFNATTMEDAIENNFKLCCAEPSKYIS